MSEATAKYLDVKNDVCFKRVFSDKARMMDFLNVILKRDETNKIIDIEFMPTESLPDFGLGKRSLFDLKCKDQEGNIFIVEMQKKTNKYFLNRAQFYACTTYTTQVQRGTPHTGLLPVILVAICQHTVFPEEVDCINYHRLREEKTNKTYLFSTSYVFIELEKFNKNADELEDVVDDWLYFLSKSPEAKEPPAHTTDEHILSAYKNVERFNYTAEEYDAYIRARLAEEEDMVALDDKYQEGKKEGREEGENRQAILSAKVMLKDSMNIEKVSQYTGLSEEDIQRLKNELNN